jgi:hypothetical protein
VTQAVVTTVGFRFMNAQSQLAVLFAKPRDDGHAKRAAFAHAPFRPALPAAAAAAAIVTRE